ncbi:MAG: hypothetical protein E6240_01715 [Clostridium butyricum]|nr:hypothetical protein [Clostridium butyricum]
MYKIYKITNLTNKKVYIGRTNKHFVWRGQPEYIKGNRTRYSLKIENIHSSENFRNDIKDNLEKLGNRNIKIEILKDNILTEKEADNREIYWIAKYNSTDENFGYNSQKGGKDHRPNKKSIIKTKNTMLKNGTTKGKNNGMFGRASANSRKVICITTGEIFNCIKDAERKYNIAYQSISSCCRGTRKSAGKLNGQKLKWCYLEDYNN